MLVFLDKYNLDKYFKSLLNIYDYKQMITRNLHMIPLSR